ncbi:nucleoside triphosphate pyrophosphohydrolase [Alicyclobacillus fastidiosus]|uniref:Nucleoside triphosphate pyrophosphohydrolase n=1 Tax=Alicyclobacillus fastidiosus TaxID=392011 RepID=A0ABV5AE61_9BACL|nr:nucleoside triphosphate pyrophosphohydrolase [Alicyclobacillus fastidiosus]WEH09937.1 nucleoside triphosphate pyrophosphohydrolase [Alicyclobacillus fastidiosus]
MAVIHVVGLGPGDLGGLPMGTYQLLKSGMPIVLRTRIHPVVAQLEEQGFAFEAYDDLYETIDQFDEVYRQMAERLIEKASQGTDFIYAVPGHPLVAEQSVQNLLEQDVPGVQVDIGPGQSFLDIAAARLKIDPIDGLLLLDGTTLAGRMLNSAVHTLIAQVYQPAIAAETKLTLMEVYPDDYEITVLRAAGVAHEERIEQIPLYELDRVPWVDHLTTVYVPPMESRANRLRDPWEAIDIVAALRAPGGCPWDREQTHESLRKYVIEEAYEVAEAIDAADYDHLAEELGDLLLQVLLHAQIGEEFGEFSIRDVFERLAAKLIRRHPHVFAGETAADVSDANQLWDEVKQAERASKDSPRILDDVSLSGPALTVAAEIQKAAAKVGFDWKQVKDVLEKIKEEMTELEEELRAGDDTDAADEELGDLLFACVNLSRFRKKDAEVLLMRATRKFVDRFNLVESAVRESGRDWDSFSLDELDEFWGNAKIELQDKN